MLFKFDAEKSMIRSLTYCKLCNSLIYKSILFVIWMSKAISWMTMKGSTLFGTLRAFNHF
jgi:hypothetical protein